MPIEIRCPGCASQLRLPDEYAGKTARCQKCGQTFVIPAPASQEPASTAVTAELPKASPVEEGVDQKPTKPATPPRVPEDNRQRSRRDRSRQTSTSIMPWVLSGCAAVFVLGVLLVGGGAAMVFLLMPRHPNDPIVEAPRHDNPWKNPHPDPNWPPPDGKPNWPPPDAKPIEPKPAPKEPPVAVVLADGKFETMVTFPRVDPQPNQQRQSREYQFTTKADAAYSIVASDRLELRVTGPDGDVGKRNHRFGEPSQHVVFLTTKAAMHSIVVECFPFNNAPQCKLTIKELDGTEVLPGHLKIQSNPADLPTLVSAIQIKRFTGAAFAPDNKFFWIAHADSTLSLWENPGFERKGEYNTAGQNLFALCVDNQGRLYAQSSKANRDPGFGAPPRGISDISVYENLDPAKSPGALPAPTKRIPLAGIVKRMLHSPDGRWIYGLDTHNRRLFRIDTQKGAIDKEITNISTSSRSFCLTPDGKTIYCCSATNRIDIIDPVEFKLIRSVSLDKSQPMDICATNKGVVFLAGSPSGGHGEGSGNAYVADLSGKPAERATAFGFDMGVGNGTVGSNSVLMHPDERAAFLSGDGAIVAAHVPVRPALVSIRGHERVRQGYEQGHMVLSPDGRTLLHNTLGILSVSR